MVVLILLGIAFSTFSTTREGKEQAKSSHLRSEDSVQQQGLTPAEQEMSLNRSTGLAAPAFSLGEQDRLAEQLRARGKVVFERLATQRQDLQPIVWGVTTELPAVALLLSEQEWSMLSKE
jgi:hypothetical protein